MVHHMVAEVGYDGHRTPTKMCGRSWITGYMEVTFTMVNDW